MVQYHRDEPGQTAQPAPPGAASGVKSDRRERRVRVLRVPLVRDEFWRDYREAQGAG